MSFDYQSALEAAAELKATADALLTAAGLVLDAAPVVTEDWSGPFREVFDVESMQYYSALVTLGEDLLLLRTAIRAEVLRHYAEVDGPLQRGLEEDWDESDLANFEAQLDSDLEDMEISTDLPPVEPGEIISGTRSSGSGLGILRGCRGSFPSADRAERSYVRRRSMTRACATYANPAAMTGSRS